MSTPRAIITARNLMTEKRMRRSLRTRITTVKGSMIMTLAWRG